MTSPQAILIINGPSLFDLGMAVMELIHFSAVRRRKFPPIILAPSSSQLVFTLTSGERNTPEFTVPVRCVDVLGVRRQCGGFDGLFLELTFDAHEDLPWNFDSKILHVFYDESSQLGFVSMRPLDERDGQYYVTQDKSIGFKPATGGQGVLIYDARERKWELDKIPC
jgi:hypothetical protein